VAPRIAARVPFLFFFVFMILFLFFFNVVHTGHNRTLNLTLNDLTVCTLLWFLIARKAQNLIARKAQNLKLKPSEFPLAGFCGEGDFVSASCC